MRWKTTGAWVSLLVINVGLALGVATLIRLQFLVSSEDEMNPPICYNHFGDTVGCSLHDSTALLYLGFFCGLFVLITAGELIVWKRRRTS